MKGQKIAEKIVALKWVTMVIVVALTLFLGSQLKHLSVNADILQSLPDDDVHAELLKRIAKNFGGNNMGVVILETDNIYQTKVLEQVRSITDSLVDMEGIASVSSLTNIIQIKGGDGGIEVGTLVDEYELPADSDDLESLKKNVMSNEMYRGTIVSEDGTSTLIIFTLENNADVAIVAAKVIDLTKEIRTTEKLYYTGSPMLVSAISNLMRRDLTTLLPIAFILIAIVLYVSFRSVIGVFLPLITAAIAIVWCLGIMSLLSYKMSMISNNIPIILLAIGSSYAIHVINRIQHQNLSGTKNDISVPLGLVLVPIVLAAITTGVGFISFIFGAYLEMIVEFGIFTTLGTGIACILSIFFVPALIEIFGAGKNKKELRERKKSRILDTLLGQVNTLLFKYPGKILISWGLVLCLSLAGIFSIERKVDIQEYFKKDNPTRQAEAIMVDKFGGTKPVFVLFRGNIKSPEVLKKMIQTADYMEKSPDIYTSMSVAKLVSEINLAIAGEREIPSEIEKIEQLWFLIDGNETLERLVNEDLTEGIIISKFKSPDNASKKRFAAYMNTFISANTTATCQIEITGMPFVDITMDRSLIRSQMGSIIIALIFMVLIVGLFLRSWVNGFLAAVPIIASIIILFGIMGLTGISLNIATVLVASVALGIGIDYSIHIISQFKQGMQTNGELKWAIENAINISGKAIIINVISVTLGFLVLLFSEMVPLQYFGLLIGISMLSSGLGALTLLPAILIVLHKRNNKNQLK